MIAKWMHEKTDQEISEYMQTSKNNLLVLAGWFTIGLILTATNIYKYSGGGHPEILMLMVTMILIGEAALLSGMGVELKRQRQAKKYLAQRLQENANASTSQS